MDPFTLHLTALGQALSSTICAHHPLAGFRDAGGDVRAGGCLLLPIWRQQSVAQQPKRQGVFLHAADPKCSVA
jgi:hypothetical protein